MADPAVWAQIAAAVTSAGIAAIAIAAIPLAYSWLRWERRRAADQDAWARLRAQAVMARPRTPRPARTAAGRLATVTRAQVRAAQGRIDLDRRRSRETPDWIQRVAAAKPVRREP